MNADDDDDIDCGMHAYLHFAANEDGDDDGQKFNVRRLD